MTEEFRLEWHAIVGNTIWTVIFLRHILVKHYNRNRLRRTLLSKTDIGVSRNHSKLKVRLLCENVSNYAISCMSSWLLFDTTTLLGTIRSLSRRNDFPPRSNWRQCPDPGVLLFRKLTFRSAQSWCIVITCMCTENFLSMTLLFPTKRLYL